ncbi:restriction endonuclease subunit S [Bradyrhizobium sp. 613_E4_N2_2]|uniref:restriction endonuclease subunit S n=1 Tax=Bradyrhizobium sp. 613_E4_N2_2 TaxID=3240371 RepID=UPI003F8B48F2
MTIWKSTTLGHVVELQRGFDLPEYKRRPGKVPVIGSAGPTGWHDTAVVEGPGIVIGRAGASAGEVTYVREPFWPHNTTLFVKNFRGNDPKFLYFFCRRCHSATLLGSGATDVEQELRLHTSGAASATSDADSHRLHPRSL